MISNEEREALLMKAVDGRLSQEEEARLAEWLREDEALAAELDEYRQIKDATDAMRARIWADANLEPYRPPPQTRRLLGSGFALVFVAAVLLMAFVARIILWAPDVPVMLKGAFGLGAFGAVLLFAYVFRVRWRGRGKDPYEEIDR